MKKIAIIGAGVAGLSLGCMLDRDKYSVTVFERREKFSTVGFGIVLWRSGLDILEEILNGNIDDWTTKIESLDFYLSKNFKLAEKFNCDGLARTMKRNSLIEKLGNKFNEIHGSKSVRFSSKIDHIDSENNVCVIDGERFDIVIVADGVGSKIRSSYFDFTKTREKYDATYTWVDAHNTGFNAVAFFDSSHAGFLSPIGDKYIFGYYKVDDGERESDYEQRILSFLKDKYRLTLKIDNDSQKRFNVESISVQTAKHDSVFIIGDALHAHPPTLGMGTSVSLEDAAVLAKRLNKNAQEYTSNQFLEERSNRIKQVYSFQKGFEDFLLGKPNAELSLKAFILRSGLNKLKERQMMSIISP